MERIKSLLELLGIALIATVLAVGGLLLYLTVGLLNFAMNPIAWIAAAVVYFIYRKAGG